MHEVLVVGAGPTGLVLAIQLRRFGVTCRVIDRAEGPATTSRALGCHVRTLEILGELGVLDELMRRSRPLLGATYHRGERAIARMRWEPQEGANPFPRVLPQAELEELLRARLAALGGKIEWGRELVNLHQETDHVVTRLADGEEARAAWLVGCDGAHSRVREAAGIAFVGASYPEVYYLGDVALDLHGAESKVWLGSMMLGLVPLDEHGRWRVFADVTPDPPGARVPPPTLAALQQLLDERAFGPGKLRILGSTWLSVFRLQRRQAERYRAGRVFVAGDAAHAFPPFGGQGMNTGIGDAHNLAWKLAAVFRGWGSHALLDTYHAERHPLAAAIIEQVDRSTRVMTWRHPLATAWRELLFRTLLRVPAFRRATSRRSSGLTRHYRHATWLSEQVQTSPGPQAGDRAPDGPLAGAGLLARRDGTRFTLLVFPDADPAPIADALGDAVEVLVVSRAERELRRIYGAQRGALVLVRPDGHIGFRGGPGDLPALRRYLARIFGAPRSVADATIPRADPRRSG